MDIKSIHKPISERAQAKNPFSSVNNKKCDLEVIKVSRLADDHFKLFLDKSLTLGELELYTSRLAYYLAKRWTNLEGKPIDESVNAVSLAMLEHMKEWNEGDE